MNSLLQELLQINEDRIDKILLEDLGNLKAIDVKFLKALKTSSHRYKDGSSVPVIINTLANRVGKNSQIEEVPLKNATAVANEFDANPGIVAIVICDKKTDTQFAVIAERAVATYKGPRKIAIAIDIDACAGQGADKEQLSLTERHFKTKLSTSLGYYSNVQNICITEIAYDTKKIYNAINTINKFVKAPHRELVVKFVIADAERVQKQVARSESRKGVIPVNLSGKEKTNFIQQAKLSLKMKLDEFKKAKLKSQNKNISLEDFGAAVKKDGYLDKFLVGGFIYQYYRDSFNFNSLRAGRHKTGSYESDKSFVTYKIDDDAPEYTEVRTKFWHGRAKIGLDFADDEEAYAKEVIKLKARLKLPPTYIKVFFDFEGGNIVPSHIELEGDM